MMKLLRSWFNQVVVRRLWVVSVVALVSKSAWCVELLEFDCGSISSNVTAKLVTDQELSWVKYDLFRSGEALVPLFRGVALQSVPMGGGRTDFWGGAPGLEMTVQRTGTIAASMWFENSEFAREEFSCKVARTKYERRRRCPHGVCSQE